MILLILGLALWFGAHMFKRAKPAARARMGDKDKGVIAGLLLLALVLMTVGVRGAPFIPVWTPPLFLVHLNNLLVLFAFYCFAMAGQGVFLDRKIRHSQLTGVKAWAVAHLLVNGDLVSIILFGGLLAWGVVELIAINKAEPEWTPPPRASTGREVLVAVVAVVAYGIVGWLHTLLGYNPFAG